MNSLVAHFVSPLERAGIGYAVTGGLASVIYGHPRLTVDVDLVLALSPSDTARFAAIWPPVDFYCPDADTLRGESTRGAHGHFNVYHHATGLRADVYLAGTDPFQRWALDHARRVMFDGSEIRVAPIEYVIVFKLRYVRDGGSRRHLTDVARIMNVNEAMIDRPTLTGWVEQYRVHAELAEAEGLRAEG
ncbi:MAG: hypothetical protein K2X99_00025 [Gemmatimonadaceae bacterium]|nr:hypothetical protein [Gemmatimonadaceae bacterium]